MKLFRIATVPISLNVLLNGQLKFLNQYFDVTAVSGSGTDLECVAEREGVCTRSVRIERKISLFRDVISLFRLYFLYRKEKPEIIHSITPKAGLLSMVAGKWAGVPVRMHTFTGLIFPYRKGVLRWILVLMDRVLCHHATHIYPEGKGVKEDLTKYRITAKPLKILADGNVNGIDTEFFNPKAVHASQRKRLRRELGISEDDFVFIFVGRLVTDKGINELVAAFKKISSPANQNLASSTGVKLLLVGPLERNDRLLPKTITEIRNSPHIIAVGFQQDVRSYYAISDALVFPSYREGFPNVVLQAGAMELPSIVTDISGCNEIIHNENNGLVIPVKNEAVLRQAMIRMVEDGELRLRLKSNMRAEIEEKYSQFKVWEALKAEYEVLTPIPSDPEINLSHDPVFN